MHVGPTVEEPYLGPVSSLVAVVADVHRHVHILDAMNQEPQGETAILDGLARVLQRQLELVDLVDDASLA